MRSPTETLFELLLAEAGLGYWETQYRFTDTRRWTFDFARPGALLAIEIDGGTRLRNGGRHNSDADREKLNYAAALGWRVLHFSTKQVEDTPAECIEMVRMALRRRLWGDDAMSTMQTYHCQCDVDGRLKPPNCEQEKPNARCVLLKCSAAQWTKIVCLTCRHMADDGLKTETSVQCSLTGEKTWYGGRCIGGWEIAL